MTLSHRNALCHRIRCLGLDQRVTTQLVDQMCFWTGKSGEEWTVQRIKSLKVDYINWLAGREPVGSWIARRGRGIPRGPFGALWSLRPAQSLAVLNVYSALIATRITPKQWEKFHQSVTSGLEPRAEECERFALRMGRSLDFVIRDLHLKRTGTPRIDLYSWSPRKRAPLGWKAGTVPEPDVLDSLALFRTPIGTGLRSFKNVQEVLANVQHLIPPIGGGYVFPDGSRPRGSVGSIGFIQEPGYKLRAVANPHRVLQLALIPLAKTLFRVVKEYKSDYTFDQPAGVSRIQKLIASGQRAWSVDLSDATNHFPLRIQTEGLGMALQAGGYREDDLTLFLFSSMAPWTVRLRDGSVSELEWTKGQPLGLYPSFASFALAHHAVVRESCLDAGYPIERADEAYCLLGDDIVIFNKRVYHNYRNNLDALCVPVSETKTLENARVAEFAGKVITSSQIIALPKYRRMSDDSFVDIVRQFGPASTSLCRLRQKAVLKWLAPLPEECGGLGWNPKGLPLGQRIDLAHRWIFRERRDLRSYEDPVTRLRRETNRLLYEGSLLENFIDEPWYPSAVPQLGTVKERVHSVTGVTKELVDENSLAVPTSGWVPSVPAPSRVTTLEVLEKFSPDNTTQVPEESLAPKKRSKRLR